MEWIPHVTVATIVENDGRFLLVEESVNGHTCFNQPAGHLDPGETLVEAAIRETLEETGWEVEIQGVVGVGLYKAPRNGVTYCRTTFFAKAIRQLPDAQLDHGIIAPRWLTLDEIRQLGNRLRSPLVLQTIENYRNGHRYPLDMVYHAI